MNIRIRALKEDDIWMLHKWINDPEVVQYTNNFRPISEMEQIKWFHDTDYFKQNSVFGIECISDKEIIGTCGLYDINSINRKAELRIKIGEKTYRGKGFGGEALAQLLDFGFKDLNLHKIWLKVLTDNKAAVKLYEKMGFINEGILRKDIYIHGIYHDLFVMSILQDEYFLSTKENADV